MTQSARLSRRPRISRRTPDLTPNATLSWDLGVATPANVFALMGTNASLGATAQFVAADDAAYSVNVITSGAMASPFDTSLGFDLMTYVPPWGRTLIYVGAQSWSKRYIRWIQSDTGN